MNRPGTFSAGSFPSSFTDTRESPFLDRSRAEDNHDGPTAQVLVEPQEPRLEYVTAVRRLPQNI